MNQPQRCSIKSLKLFNFRCFEELNISFHDHLSVFVAPNGCGKTAILDAVAVALRLFTDTIEGRFTSKGFDTKDIRLVQNPVKQMEQVPPVRFDAFGCFFGRCIRWARERHSEKSSRTTTSEALELKKLANELVKGNLLWAQKKEPVAPVFPIIAYYGTGRLWATTKIVKEKAEKQAPNARFRGYADCLNPASHYKFFLEWFERHSRQEMALLAYGLSSQEQASVGSLDSIKSAVDIALSPSGWQKLSWDFKENCAVAYHPEKGTLPVETLSDGIRNMIGLVADIAHRAVRLNPELGADAHLKTPGIVLIDEVDMHLHPQWQQLVLQSLQTAFPMMQFIVTTHSPQVLSTVQAESIFMIDQAADGSWSIVQPGRQTQGVESSLVMAEVMRTDQTPALPIIDRLNEYYALIQTHRFDTDAGRDLRAQLVAHYGSDHPVIQEADRMISIERFKLTLNKPEKGG